MERADERAHGGGRRELRTGWSWRRGRARDRGGGLTPRVAQRRLLRGRGGAARAALPRDGRAVRARRAAAGGGVSPTARSDVRHVAVEFVHPVIVGKRALPALGLVGEAGRCGRGQAGRRPDDIVMAFDAERLRRRRAPALTVAFADAARRATTRSSARSWWRRSTTCCGSSCTCSSSTAGCRAGRTTRRVLPVSVPRRGGADLDAVLADVAASVRMKAEEVASCASRRCGGRRRWGGGRCAARRFDAGGRLLVLGNGGSATDAMDIAADFRHPPRALAGAPGARSDRRCAIVTALANDIGFENVFSRQVIAHGRAGDVLLAISTSGGSGNVLAALAEARRRGMATIALVGYDGGEIASGGLADHVVVTRRSTSRASRRRRRAPTTCCGSSWGDDADARPRRRGRSVQGVGFRPFVHRLARRAGAGRLRAQRRARGAGGGEGEPDVRRRTSSIGCAPTRRRWRTSSAVLAEDVEPAAGAAS